MTLASAALLLQVQIATRWRVEEALRVVAGSARAFSGLAALSGGTLAAVDDKGRVSEWSADGLRLREVELDGAPDLEDIAIDPRDGALWLAVEDTGELLRLDAAAWRVAGRWSAPREVPRKDKGIESLAFVPVGADRFELWIGHQSAKAVFVAAEPPPAPGELTLLRKIELGDEPRALVFDLASRSVLAAFSEKPRIARIALDGRELDSFPFAMPPHTVEGLALDRSGRLWACADGGDVVRMAPSGPSLQAGSSASAHLEHRATIDVPAKTPEIVSLSADGSLLLANDAESRSIVIHSLRRTANAFELPLAAPTDPATKAHVFEGEPTSVATHPSLAIAFATVLAEKDTERGRVAALDLRPATLGRELWTQRVGHHPDSVAVSADGRWIVVADEGEGDDDPRSTPGSVSVLDLAKLDVFEPRPSDGPIPAWEFDVSAGIARDAGSTEPEFVAIDPRSRFAVVTCQENDAAVVIALASPPRVMPVRFALSHGAEPDGVAVLDGFTDPELGPGALVAFAEEGEAERGERPAGQAVSFWWLGPEPSFERAVPLSRVDLVGPLDGGKRPQPENVVFLRREGALFAAVAAERAGCVALLSLADARSPKLLSAAPVGTRPEGLCVLEQGGRTWLVTGDEGPGPGTISFVELVP
jgi:DNA-binding beta-propeller fold protein YncE